MSLEDLVPHRPPMLWLDDVETSDDTSTTCALTVRADHPLSDGSSVPGTAVVEWIAQTAAVHAGLGRRRAGLGPLPGMVTGCSRVSWPAEGFAVGTALRVRVTQEHGGDGPLAAFLGVVLQGDVEVARGTVSVARGTGS
jgi:predicted hotdog family 3-hydroxylacyl-ACP dehydratase